MTASLFPAAAECGATFSPDRLHRYRLWRRWGDVSRRCVWIGVNPSTADEVDDDATIRKCIGFSQRWAFGACDILNLFAFRSTDIRGLRLAEDPVGVGNDQAIADVCANAARVVVAWGATAKFAGIASRAKVVTEIVRRHAPGEVGTLGPRLDCGGPRHPLMPAYTTPFVLEAGSPR